MQIILKLSCGIWTLHGSVVTNVQCFVLEEMNIKKIKHFWVIKLVTFSPGGNRMFTERKSELMILVNSGWVL
ncbi:unnamed protein product [Litomosoides sigmodontis]|uniref:Uncharacterized protein n=1 Tax=Litomosoides sigmodontis TaxID=42156 RepID=A0A3P6T6K7_LITSI|nr:unnamed protein product [Litomosoides sigmodontis]